MFLLICTWFFYCLYVVTWSCFYLRQDYFLANVWQRWQRNTVKTTKNHESMSEYYFFSVRYWEVATHIYQKKYFMSTVNEIQKEAQSTYAAHTSVCMQFYVCVCLLVNLMCLLLLGVQGGISNILFLSPIDTYRQSIGNELYNIWWTSSENKSYQYQEV